MTQALTIAQQHMDVVTAITVEITPGHVIASQEEFTAAGELLVGLKTVSNTVDAARMALARPYLDAKAEVDEAFRPVLTKLKAAEMNLRAMIGAYTQAQQVEQRRLAQLTAETAATREEFSTGMQAATAAAAPAVAGISTRATWAWELVDIMQAPPEYVVLAPNAAALDAAVAAGVRDIPGFRVVQRTSVVVRTRG